MGKNTKRDSQLLLLKEIKNFAEAIKKNGKSLQIVAATLKENNNDVVAENYAIKVDTCVDNLFKVNVLIDELKDAILYEIEVGDNIIKSSK